MIKNVTPRGISFSRIEIEHLVKSWIAISVAFTILKTRQIPGYNLVILFIISAFTVGVGFVLHELAHKIVAQKYHCFAEYRADFRMLLLAIVMSFMGFIYIAPGAVMINGHVTKKQLGHISLAGPLTNVVLSLLFLLLIFHPIQLIAVIGAYGFSINSWLALFNLIPIGNFDGKKILNWDKKVYFIVVGVFLAIRGLGFYLFGI